MYKTPVKENGERKARMWRLCACECVYEEPHSRNIPSPFDQ